MSSPADAVIPGASEGDGMTVVSLTVENFKRIRAAQVRPSPDGLVLIRGRNGAGKSSLIESMLEGLGIERSALPITDGEPRSEVLIDLGQIVVCNRWKRDSGGDAKRVLTVEAANGSAVRSPQAVLKNLVGYFADPVAFIEMPAADQVKTVLGVLGLDKRLRELEERAQAQYDERRDLGRDADQKTKAERELQEEMAGLPVAKPEGSIDELTQQLQAAKDHNANIDKVNVRILEVKRYGKERADRIEALKAQLAQAEQERAQALDEWNRLSEWRNSAKPIDVAPIVTQIRAHEEAARYAGRMEVYEQTQRDAEKARARHQQADIALEATRAEIATLLETAQFPVEGMTYDPDGKQLKIGGIPFAQASQSQRIDAAADIAMAGTPRFKVLFVREGSLFDEESRMRLHARAKARKFQVWFEVVDSHQEGVGIWIEDGVAYQSEALEAQ